MALIELRAGEGSGSDVGVSVSMSVKDEIWASCVVKGNVVRKIS